MIFSNLGWEKIFFIPPKNGKNILWGALKRHLGHWKFFWTHLWCTGILLSSHAKIAPLLKKNLFIAIPSPNMFRFLSKNPSRSSYSSCSTHTMGLQYVLVQLNTVSFLSKFFQRIIKIRQLIHLFNFPLQLQKVNIYLVYDCYALQ